MPAVDFSSPNAPECFWKPRRPRASRGRELCGCASVVLNPAPTGCWFFHFSTRKPHCKPVGFVLRCSDVAATSLWGSLGALSRGRVGGWVPNPLSGAEARSLFTPAKFPGAQPAPLKHLQKGNPNKARLLSICVYLNYWRSPSHGSRLNLYK